MYKNNNNECLKPFTVQALYTGTRFSSGECSLDSEYSDITDLCTVHTLWTGTICGTGYGPLSRTLWHAEDCWVK